MHRLAASTLILAAFLGCYGGSSGASPDGTAGADAGGTSPTGAKAVDLPCDVATFVTARCLACHGEGGSAGLPLTTRAAFAATAKGDTRSVGEVALGRLRDDAAPMPPSPAERASDAEIQTLEAWVKGGYASGVCDSAGTPPPDPFDTPVVCTSGARWTRGDRESPDMHPGVACIACHTEKKEGPTLAFGGTIYPTAHEPDDCNGIAGKSLGATVVVTDANGKTFTAKAQASGNFFLESRTALAMPYTAKVVVGGKERVMTSPQTDGDCNGCHTEAGAAKGGEKAAPGRIMAP